MERAHDADAVAVPVTMMPTSCYLVFGEPPLRYIGHERPAPLLFHVSSGEGDGATALGRATALNMACATPNAQTFELLPMASASQHEHKHEKQQQQQQQQQQQKQKKDGNLHKQTSNMTAAISATPPVPYMLRCRVLLTQPAARVAVLANVRVEYVAGKGVVLRAGDTSPTSSSVSPRCVYERLQSTEQDVCTTQPLMLHEMRAAVYEDDESEASNHKSDNNNNNNNNSNNNGPRRTLAKMSRPQRPCVSTAPLVVVIEYDDDYASATSTRARGDDGGGGGGGTVDSADDTRHFVHYTFLDVPATSTSATHAGGKDKRNSSSGTMPHVGDHAAATSAAMAAATAAGATLHMRVARQLLQVGKEVYDLEDVFEVGVRDDDNDAASDGSGREQDAVEQNVCVICLANANDTTLLPCRHMCVCHECAAQLRLGTNRCPLCRTMIEQVMTL